MRAVHRLEVHLRVPVAVVDDDGIGGGEVDTQTSGAGGEEEDKLLRAGGVVRVDHVLARVPVGVTVDAAVLVPAEEEVILEDVEEAGHLGEDEDAAALLLELLEQLIEEDHLTGVLHEVLAGEEGRAGLGTLEQIRVVAALAQLHHHVQQSAPVAAAVHNLDVLLERALVVVLLHLGQANLEDHLLLGGQVLLNLRLEAAQEERPEDLVQLLHHLRGLLVALFAGAGAEPLLELPGVAEDLGE